MIQITDNINESINWLVKMSNKASDIPTILDIIARPSLMASSKRSFINQISPDGEKWDPSQLAIDEGRPHQTLIRKPELFPEQQDISSFPIEGNKLLEISNLPQSVWNFKDWRFAGMDDQAIESVQNKTISYLLDF